MRAQISFNAYPWLGVLINCWVLYRKGYSRFLQPDVQLFPYLSCLDGWSGSTYLCKYPVHFIN